MRPFEYVRAGNVQEAQTLVATPRGRFIAGGTDVLNLLKDGVQEADRLVDLGALPLAGIDVGRGLVRLGGLAKLSDVAAHPVVRSGLPGLSQALEASASPQIRTMGTLAGNLLQRTRCWYFRDPAVACNKRVPGSGCPAQEGQNRQHAILGGSGQCIAVQPSDLAVALLALDAVVVIRGAEGAERRTALDDFYLLPGDTPDRETVVAPGDLVVAIEVPTTALAASSRYLKVRDRASFEFATVSVAAAVRREGGVVREAALAFGGIATRPWRSRAAEQALLGAPLTGSSIAAAGRELVRDAVPREHNAFKVELVQRALAEALTGAPATTGAQR